MYNENINKGIKIASDLGKSCKLKKIKINYPNGDVYEGMGAAYYNPPYEPHGIGRYYQSLVELLSKQTGSGEEDQTLNQYE